MKLKNKLAVYQSYLPTEMKKQKLQSEAKQEHIDIPNLEKWHKFGVTPYILDDQYCLIREVRFPLETQRGKYTFSDYLNVVDAWQNHSLLHPLSAKGYQPTDLFFFDTETTGLGGGVGNTIFLLGYAFIDNDEIVVKQHLLPEPGGEIPLYHSFLKSVDYTTLVTYNGKAFDWPQVKTRHTLIREHVPKLPAFGHFDLLHASRRLWKDKLPSVKLTIVEKEILGIEREEDVPGYLAPIIYFDFLQSKQLDGIVKVMEHNEEDVLSLIILYTHISYQLLGLDTNQTDREKLAVGKWYSALNERDAAIQVYEKAITNLRGREKWKGMYDLATQYKKQKKRDMAVAIWQEIIEQGDGIEKIDACIELAKVQEHVNKDFEKALQFCILAKEEYESTQILDGKNNKLLEELEKRILRLKGKMRKV
mgnify:FL=1